MARIHRNSKPTRFNTLAEELRRLYSARTAMERSQQAYNTQKGYAADWKLFAAWCQQKRRKSLPATTDTVALYITSLLERGLKVSTAVRLTSSVSWHHRDAGHATPVTAEIWSLLTGARRMLRQGVRQMRPITVDQLREISGVLRVEGTPEALRDRAVLVLGFASALRRCNIVQLLLSDITFVQEGIVIQVRREKQDQEGIGRSIGVVCGQHPDTDPTTCLRDWIAERGDFDGALFTRVDRGKGEWERCLIPSAVGRIVKKAVERINLDSGKYGGHSLRAGFITAAVENDCSDLLIATQSGHKSMEILRKYFRKTDLFRSNPSGKVGL